MEKFYREQLDRLIDAVHILPEYSMLYNKLSKEQQESLENLDEKAYELEVDTCIKAIYWTF